MTQCGIVIVWIKTGLQKNYNMSIMATAKTVIIIMAVKEWHGMT